LWVNLCALLIFGRSSCHTESRRTAENVCETCKYIMQNEFLAVRVFISCPARACTLLLLSFVRVHEWKKQDYCKSDTQHPFYLLQNKTIKHRLRKPLDSYRPKLNVKPYVLVTPQKCEEEKIQDFNISLSLSLSLQWNLFFQQNNHLAWNPCVQMMWLFSITY